MINKEIESATIDTKPSEPSNTGSSNVIRDLSKNTNDKPWFKKKGSIIGMSSTLGVGVLATVIAVPVALTTSATSTPHAEISGVISVYDLANTSTKLVISGANLPKEKDMYSVANVTTTRAIVDIDPAAITISSGVENPENPGVYDIYLDFIDQSLVIGTIYQVSLKNGNVVTSKSDQNVVQPTLDIAVQPKDYTISTIQPSKIATLSITISEITNPISGAVATYQWQSSDLPSTADTDWTNIVGATNNSYSYNAEGLFENEKKYFRCIVNYKYVKPIISWVGFVMIVSKPTISIIDQPMSVNLPFTATSTTLSINATVINGLDNPTISYQWEESTNETPGGPFQDIQGANTASYTFDKAATITSGTKKYFRCEVSSPGSELLVSNVIYVGRNAQPVLTFTKQIGDVDLTFNTMSTTLSVTVSIDIPIDGQNLSYKWYKSTTNTSGSTWEVINGATSREYSPSIATPDQREYFKCEVTYNSGNIITSNVGSVARLRPVITFTKEIGETNISGGNPNIVLSVEAAIANRTDTNAPTYKWYEYDNTTSGTGTVIADATSSTCTYNGSSLALNGIKYFRCEVSYPNATTTFSAYGSVSKKTSWIHIEAQPSNQMVPISSAEATVTVSAAIMHGDSTKLRYQWFKTTTNPTTGGTNTNWQNISGATGASYTTSIGSTDAERMNWPNTWYRCLITAAGIDGTVTTNPAFIKTGLSRAQATGELTNWFTNNKQKEQELLQAYFTNMTSAQRYEYYRYVNDGKFESIPDTEFVSITPITISVPGAPAFETYKIRLKTIGNKQTVYITPSNNKVASMNPGIKIEFVLLFSLRGSVQLVRERTTNNFVLDFSPKFTTSGDANKTNLAWTYDLANAPVFGYLLKPNAYPMKIISEVDNSQVVYLDNYLIDFARPDDGVINSTKYPTIPTYNSL